jgi:hypothetical protein
MVGGCQWRAGGRTMVGGCGLGRASALREVADDMRATWADECLGVGLSCASGTSRTGPAASLEAAMGRMVLEAPAIRRLRQRAPRTL